jgi:hypothetical protein
VKVCELLRFGNGRWKGTPKQTNGDIVSLHFLVLLMEEFGEGGRNEGRKTKV